MSLFTLSHRYRWGPFIVCFMWDVYSTEIGAFIVCCMVSTLHSIPWIAASFTHRTKKVEYSPSFSSELANNGNIFVFKDISTEVGTTKKAANEAKPMAIIRISLLSSCRHVAHDFYLELLASLKTWGEASERERDLLLEICAIGNSSWLSLHFLTFFFHFDALQHLRSHRCSVREFVCEIQILGSHLISPRYI